MGAASSCVTRKNRKDRKSQKGGQTGGDYGYNGPAFMSAAGAPVESRLDQIDCMEVERVAPVLSGGSRKQKQQRQKGGQTGGACGCNQLQQRGGAGSATGGFSTGVETNDLIKMPVYTAGNCATVPTRAMYGGSRKQKQQRKQRGGDSSAAAVYGLQSYTATYDMNKPVELPSGSAHYMDWTATDRTCRGGSRRQRQRKQRQKN